MRLALLCQSLISDWGDRAAPVLRGLVAELRLRGHEVRAFEPRASPPISGLLAEVGHLSLDELDAAHPLLGAARGGVVRYREDRLDLDAILDGVDAVLVDDHVEPALVAALALRRLRGGRFRLWLHDGRGRWLAARREVERSGGFDAVLVPSEALQAAWADAGCADRAVLFHASVDPHLFRPRHGARRVGELVWTGSWSTGERARDLGSYLLTPIEQLDVHATVHGHAYPAEAQAMLRRAAVRRGGWVPGWRMPDVLSGHRATVHVPRHDPLLAGAPPHRVLEALACGVPVVSAPWPDAEGVLSPGMDFLLARSPSHATELLRALLHDEGLRQAVARHGRHTVLTRHTAAHRIDTLLALAGTTAPAVAREVEAV